MPTTRRDGAGPSPKVREAGWGDLVHLAERLYRIASALFRDRADQLLLALLMPAQAVQTFQERPSGSLRGRRFDRRQGPAQLGEKPRVLPLELVELVRPGRCKSVERGKEDALLEVEMRDQGRGETIERMASVGASTALERGGDFPAQRIELAVLFRGLLREAFHPVSQADLEGRHAVRVPEARGACGAPGVTVTQERAAACAGPRGMANP